MKHRRLIIDVLVCVGLLLSLLSFLFFLFFFFFSSSSFCCSEHSRSWVVDMSRINFKDDIGCTCGECL